MEQKEFEEIGYQMKMLFLEEYYRYYYENEYTKIESFIKWKKNWRINK